MEKKKSLGTICWYPIIGATDSGCQKEELTTGKLVITFAQVSAEAVPCCTLEQRRQLSCLLMTVETK